MREEEFDQLVGEMKNRPLPPCPRTMERNVLRRVRLRAAEADATAGDWVFGLLPRPGFVLGAIVLTIALSSGISLYTSQSRLAGQADQRVAARALDFEVFHTPEVFSLEDK